MRRIVVLPLLFAFLCLFLGCAATAPGRPSPYPERSDLGRGNIGVTDPVLLAPF